MTQAMLNRNSSHLENPDVGDLWDGYNDRSIRRTIDRSIKLCVLPDDFWVEARILFARLTNFVANHTVSK